MAISRMRTYLQELHVIVFMILSTICMHLLNRSTSLYPLIFKRCDASRIGICWLVNNLVTNDSSACGVCLLKVP